MNILPLILSFIVGTSYFFMMKGSIPPNTNCSFIANIWTDIFAFLYGLIIIYKGNINNDNILLFLGGSIIVEHIWQLFPKTL